LFTSKWWQNLPSPRTPLPSDGRGEQQTSGAQKLGPFVLLATGLILFQLILGATMRHQHAGLAIPDFPLAYGKIWPAMDAASVAHYNELRMEVTAPNPITAFQIGLQIAHRIMALMILVAVAVAAWTSVRELGRRHPISKLTLFWVGLILVQATLGAATIWSNKAADIATAHVLGGALSLVTGALLCIISVRRGESVREHVRSASVLETVPGTPFVTKSPAAMLKS